MENVKAIYSEKMSAIRKPNLLVLIITAIVAGILCGWWMNEPVTRIFITFNSLFSNFLGFCIPLIIIGFVTPAIADLGFKAGKMLVTSII